MLLALQPPEVTTQPPAVQGGAALLWFVLPIVVFTLWLVIASRRRSRRDGRPGRWSMRGGGAVGNALNDLNAMLMPNRPDAAVMHRIEEEPQRDDTGDGREPKPGPPPA
jgi:hypothetical protein